MAYQAATQGVAHGYRLARTLTPTFIFVLAVKDLTQNQSLCLIERIDWNFVIYPLYTTARAYVTSHASESWSGTLNKVRKHCFIGFPVIGILTRLVVVAL